MAAASAVASYFAPVRDAFAQLGLSEMAHSAPWLNRRNLGIAAAVAAAPVALTALYHAAMRVWFPVRPWFSFTAGGLVRRSQISGAVVHSPALFKVGEI